METGTRKADVKSFKTNLSEAFEHRDVYVPQEDVETFIQLNWFDHDDSYEELSSWSFSDFLEFATDICAAWGGFWEVVHQYGFYKPERLEEEDD